MAKALSNFLYVALLALSNSVAAEQFGIEVRNFTLHQAKQPNVLIANVRVHHNMSEHLRDSLLNGITLHHEWQFDLLAQRRYWPDKNQRLATLRAQLRYNPLSRSYQVLDISRRQTWSFKHLPTALSHLGTLRGYQLPPIAEANFKDGKHAILVRARLSPAPRRTPLMTFNSLIGRSQELSGPGAKWQLKP